MFDRIENDADEARVAQLATETFNFPMERWEQWKQVMPCEQHRVWRIDSQIAAALAVYDAGQWYGGRTVSMAGIALVCVDATQRKQGLSQRLLTATLREYHDNNVGLATLYPSTQKPYRRVGFEQGGHYVVFEHDLYPAASKHDLLPMHQVDTMTAEPFRLVDRLRAEWANGVLQRDEGLWKRVFDTRGNPTPIRGYLIGDKEQPEGAIICFDRQEDGGRNLIVKDMIAETPAAAATLWQFIYSHRSVCKKVVWPGSPDDPLLLETAECRPQVRATQRWMSRIVNVQTALSERGYPAGLSGSLVMEVNDPDIPGNSQRWKLDVDDGQASVKATNEDAQVACSIRGISALYTGLFDGLNLGRRGLIEGEPAQLSKLSQFFAGTTPWMPDAF